MKQRKKIALATLVMASILLLGISAPTASAEGGKHMGKKHRIERMEQRQKNRVERLEKRLQKAVDNGKITAEQKDAVMNKIEENKQKIAEIRKIEDRKERHEQMHKLKDEMKQWLQDQGIDPGVLFPKKFAK